jgi:uncharacterized Zn finger protein
LTSALVQKGEVTAQVQGSRPRPYDVAIEVKVLAEKDWAKLIDALASQALFVAKLLAGEMPQDIEEAFKGAGLSLFPEKRGDLKTSCSCPDSSNPCKHIAAVYYLLGEEFDRDPFLIFRLRGLERDQLLGRLTKLSPKAEETAVKEEEPPPLPDEPLPVDVKAFWSRGEAPAGLFGDVTRPPVSAPWPRRLGSFPFWRGQERFLDAMAALSRAAGQRGQEMFLGERSS